MIEMKVFGLALDEESQVPVLILKDMEIENYQKMSTIDDPVIRRLR